MSSSGRRLGSRVGAALTLTGLVVATAMAAGLVPLPFEVGFDARIWWLARLPDPYRESVYQIGTYGYYYSPAFAQLISLLNWLPWEAFLLVWGTLNAIAVVAMAGPWTLLCLAHVQGTLALLSGNTELLIFLAIALGFRHPWTWAFVFITKVSPGVGLLWFVMRRQWRALIVASTATAVVVGVSFLLAPHLWFRWLDIMWNNVGVTPPLSVQVPFVPRFLAAIALVIAGARTDRPQAVPVAAWLAQPAIWDWGVIIALPMFVDGRRWLRLIRLDQAFAKIQPSSSS